MTRAFAVIFDFDGTLVDSMPIHYEAYRRTFAEAELELAPADFYPHVGGTARETIPKFLRGRSCSRSITELHARKQEIARELLATAEIPTLATADLLPVFHGRVPMALASSGSRSGIELLLERLSWRAFFEVVICGADVSQGKPAPEIFLKAAEGIRIAPENCVVFEDTDDGVAAARAAGMSVFDVRRARAPSTMLGALV